MRNPFAPPSITEVVPESGLFRSYAARVQRLTDSPPIYAVGALLAGLSAVVAPKANIIFRSGKMERHEPMQLWVALLGKSNNRKSHAVDMMLQALDPFLKDRVCPESGSREGFERFLMAQPHAMFAIREAPTWLSDNRAVWTRNGAAWFCKLFDGVLEPKLKGEKDDPVDDQPKKPLKLKYPVKVSLCLAGATSATLAASRPTDWSGGLFSRMLILEAGKVKPRDLFFDWTAADLDYIHKTIQGILVLLKRDPEVVVSEDAWSVFRTWNNPLQDSLDGLSIGTEAVLSRLSRHVKVVSALYALGCGQNVVSVEHMKAACKLGQFSHQKVLGLHIP